MGLLAWLAVIAISVTLNTTLSYGVKQLVESYRMPTASMQPTLFGTNAKTGYPGDHVFAEKVSYRFSEPKRGDIIVFSTNGIDQVPSETVFIKRIVGLPGERISINPPHLLVNGQPISTSANNQNFQLAHEHPNAKLTKPTDEIQLGPDEYFATGDNQDKSFDSRYFGPIKRKNIVGRITRIYLLARCPSGRE